MRKLILVMTTVVVLSFGMAMPALAHGSQFGCDTAADATMRGAPNSAPGTAAVLARCGG